MLSYQDIGRQRGGGTRGMEIMVNSEILHKKHINEQWKQEYKWIILSVVVALVFLVLHLKSVILSLSCLFFLAVSTMVAQALYASFLRQHCQSLFCTNLCDSAWVFGAFYSQFGSQVLRCLSFQLASPPTSRPRAGDNKV